MSSRNRTLEGATTMVSSAGATFFDPPFSSVAGTRGEGNGTSTGTWRITSGPKHGPKAKGSGQAMRQRKGGNIAFAIEWMLSARWPAYRRA